MRVETSPRRIVTVLLVATQALSATAGGADEAQHATLQSKAEQQRLAAELLSDMAKFLAALPGFEVSLVGSYDVLQDSGQKIEFNEVRRVAVARPDRLRME